MAISSNKDFRIDDILWEDFKKACKKNNTTRGAVLRKMIGEYVKKHKERKPKTNENKREYWR